MVYQPPGEIIDRAAAYFGTGGVGLTEKERSPCCIAFEGVGGYVAVVIEEKDKERSVDVEAREWEYQARQFMELI